MLTCVAFLCDLMICRKECLLKERRFKEDIVDLAKGINKESQEVVRISTNVAGECTDSIMTKVGIATAYRDASTVDSSMTFFMNL